MRVPNQRTTITASVAGMGRTKIYRVLPDYYYKEPENYLAFWLSLIQFAKSSRTLPDDLTKCMSEIYHKGGINCFFVTHWHQLTSETDGDCRNIRNMLQADASGQKPKRRTRQYDLLRYIDICLQYRDERYARYVAEWCRHQELCLGEEDEEDF